jgi:hypothetical protein
VHLEDGRYLESGLGGHGIGTFSARRLVRCNPVPSALKKIFVSCRECHSARQTVNQDCRISHGFSATSRILRLCWAVLIRPAALSPLAAAFFFSISFLNSRLCFQCLQKRSVARLKSDHTRSGCTTWEAFEGMPRETFCKKFPPAPPSKTPNYCKYFQLEVDSQLS